MSRDQPESCRVISNLLLKSCQTVPKLQLSLLHEAIYQNTGSHRPQLPVMIFRTVHLRYLSSLTVPTPLVVGVVLEPPIW